MASLRAISKAPKPARNKDRQDSGKENAMRDAPDVQTSKPFDPQGALAGSLLSEALPAQAPVHGMGRAASMAARARHGLAALKPHGANRVLMVGDGQRALELSGLVRQAGPRYQLAGSVSHLAGRDAGEATETPGLCETAKRLNANKVVVSFPERRGVLPLREMLSCKFSGIEVLDGPSLYERLTGKLSVEHITPSWLIFSNGFKITPGLTFAKRAVDIICSVAGLVLAAPIAPLVALAVALDSPGPLFFRQTRVGKNDRPFTLFKFRTMRRDAERSTGAVWASASDPRITRVGKFLRKTRLDEIPQLLNVLRGEMSLVGPRPERPEFVSTLKNSIPYYSERHFVKPGVTGWAQVRYRYGASVQDALEKLRYDLYYIKHVSLFMDLKILFLTIGVVLGTKGAR